MKLFEWIRKLTAPAASQSSEQDGDTPVAGYQNEDGRRSERIDELQRRDIVTT